MVMTSHTPLTILRLTNTMFLKLMLIVNTSVVLPASNIKLKFSMPLICIPRVVGALDLPWIIFTDLFRVVSNILENMGTRSGLFWIGEVDYRRVDTNKVIIVDGLKEKWTEIFFHTLVVALYKIYVGTVIINTEMNLKRCKYVDLINGQYF